LSIERSVNVAAPFEAATVFVPPSVPAAGFVPIATVTFAELVVTVFPPASWINATTAGEMAAVLGVVDGCVVNASRVAAPTVTLNAELASPGEAAG
jgi:hypothetical protein